MRPVLRFGAHVGRGVRRLTADAALADRRRFPRRVDDLTPESLSAIIGGQVTSLRPLDATAGTSSRARLALTGDGVPESVFVKMSAGTAGIRMLGELAGLGSPRRGSTASSPRSCAGGFHGHTDPRSTR